MRTRMVVSALAVVVLAAPAAALAHRSATASETRAIKAAVAAYIKNPSSHAAPDNKVVKALVSTVDGRYASARLTSVSGNSTALLKRSGKHWKVVGFGQSQPCSLASKAVRADLGVKCGME